ncbi:MAG: NAD(P)H-quinone oxidoreductase [Woeseiaceae bacterium]
MQAIEITTPGGPDVLKPAERPVPHPGATEVVIKVGAAGVNRPDCFQRAGLYPAPPDASDLPGLEVAGVVAMVGDENGRWNVGDRVCALTHGGGYAEYVAVEASHCLPTPKNIDDVLAAAIPETLFTVYSNVWMRAGLATGESLLVHGGSSGIGSMAIQLAKALGNTVITTAGTSEKCDFCSALGADLTLNYRDQDWAAEIRQQFPNGVNAVLDMVAGPYVDKNWDLLAMDGRYSMIAALGGPVAESVNMTHILRKRLTVSGSALRPQSNAQKARIAASLEENVWPLIATGGVVPMVYEQFPLENAAQAHELMESGQHMGKIVLTLS